MKSKGCPQLKETPINNMLSLNTRQQGAVLLWAIAILLVMTIVGVSAVKMSITGTQITGNSMFSMLVFQGAESSLAKTAKDYYLDTAVSTLPLREMDVDAADLPKEMATNGSLKSEVHIAWQGYDGCPITSMAISTSVSPKAGGVACQRFNLIAQTVLQGTGARTTHSLGVARLGPPLHVTLTH